jgi:hypothetical protein
MVKWVKIPSAILVLLVVGVIVFVSIGVVRQRRETSELVDKLVLNAGQHTSTSVNYESFGGLPEPVARYFRNVLRDGQRHIQVARFRQAGELKIDKDAEKWSDFEAFQVVSPLVPGFVWNARIAIAPLMHIRVRDAYVAGVVSGKVSLMSAITVAHDQGHEKLNTGALYRFLAEAVLYPTALLPEAGVKWRGVDNNCAIATLTDADISVSLEFRFNDSGEVIGIYTEDRYGLFDGQYEKHPWEGHFSKYEIRDGIRIPTEAEVGWYLPDGWWLFWKGRIVEIDFEFRE